jgi:cation transport protein ChaC
MRARGDVAIPPLGLTRALVDRLPARTDERGPVLVEAPAPDFHGRTAADILAGGDPPGTVWVFAAGSPI